MGIWDIFIPGGHVFYRVNGILFKDVYIANKGAPIKTEILSHLTQSRVADTLSFMATGNLDSFIVSARPQPQSLATSQEIRDRGSLFVATIYPASSPSQAAGCVAHLTNVHAQKPASHEIHAWRCMVLKAGRTGLGGPDDFEVREGSADDGKR